MKIIIYTSFPCLVKCDGKQERISQNEHLVLEETDKKIFVEPLGKDSYGFEIDFDSPSHLYRIIKKEDKILIFLLDGLLAENVTCHNFNYNGVKSSVEIGKRKFIFANSNSKKIIRLLSNVQNIKVGAFLFIDYVSFEDNGEDVLIAYNPKKNSAKVFRADKIELEKYGFTVHKTYFNYKQIEEHYYVDSAGLKVKNKSFVTAESMPSPIEALPYKFMIAVKCGDYAACMNMISHSLAQKLSTETLKDYFGEISYFYMISPYSCFAISNNQNKIFDFSIANDKIIDIFD